VQKKGKDGKELDGCEAPLCDTSARALGETSSLVGCPTDGADGQQGQLREAHSCPSSPTETDCSSGFSTLRKRSVTLTEKV